MNSLFKIDKTLVDNMNQNRSFIVITHKETRNESKGLPELPLGEPALLDSDAQLPQAVRDKARDLLHGAQAKAQQTIQAATARAEEIKNEARLEGYDAGMADAAGKIAEGTAAQNEEARALIEEIAEYRDGLYQQLHESVLPLAMDIAEKIINIQLQKDDKVYMEIAKKAVMGLKKSDDFMLRVGRGEFDKYFRDGGQWLREGTDCGDFEVVCDPGLEPGSLVIESDDEVVNAGVAMQLEKTWQYLKEQVE
jgi:flagellar assembly protein FliH